MEDDFIDWMWTHPPRCVSNITYEAPYQLAESLTKNYGDYSTAFGVCCSCGNRILGIRLLSLMENGKEYLVPPVYIFCKKCNKETLIFDSEMHGWDAETGAFPYKYEGTKFDYSCPACKGELFEVAVGFQYSTNEEDLKRILDDAEYNRHQDFFEWFATEVRCNTCQNIQQIMDYECA